MESKEALQGGQAVAVNRAKSRPREERLRTRLRRLRWIAEEPPPGTAQLSKAMAALAKVYDDGGRELTHVAVRRSFITRRQVPQGEMSDRRPPKGQDPPILEIASPRGIAQQLELVALFVAQTQKTRSTDSRITFELALDTTDAAATDWIDLVVPHSDHSRAPAVYATNRRDDRLRQLKRALDRLVARSLVELPNANAARGKYDGFRLLDEGGPRPTGAPLAYRVPKPGEDIIEIPIDFFLEGWVYVLTPSEIAFWLMLHDLRRRLGTSSEEPLLSVDGDTRLRCYGVKKDAYKGWWVLELAQLLDVQVDPSRRNDGTVLGFDPADPPDCHRFVLRDEGLGKPAAAAVKAALNAAFHGDDVGVARIRARTGLPSP